jgi:hypothetical protein
VSIKRYGDIKRERSSNNKNSGRRDGSDSSDGWSGFNMEEKKTGIARKAEGIDKTKEDEKEEEVR